MSEQATSLGGGVAFGGADAFGRFGVGTAKADGLDGAAFTFSGAVGFPLAFVRGPAQVCPTFAGSVAAGSTLDLHGDGSLVLNVTEVNFGFGVDVGAVVVRDEHSQLIVVGSVGIVEGNLRATSPDAPDVVLDNSDFFWLLGFGVSAVFNQGLAVRIGVASPIGLEEGAATFHVASSFNLGRKRPRQ